MSRPIDWRRLVAEGTAIVLSILLAFGIDAWWEERLERVEEREILEGLHQEFVLIEQVLGEHNAQHLERLAALEELLDIMHAGDSAGREAVIEAALLELLAPTTSDISNGTLQALLSSGRLEMIESRALRAQLVDWEGHIGEVWDDQVSNAKMVYEIHVPYFIDAGFGVGSSMRHWYAEWDAPVRPIVADPEETARLLSDPRFYALVELRYGYKKHLTQEFAAAIGAAVAIREAVEDALD